jgi:hypothetical protein
LSELMSRNCRRFELERSERLSSSSRVPWITPHLVRQRHEEG